MDIYLIHLYGVIKKIISYHLKIMILKVDPCLRILKIRKLLKTVHFIYLNVKNTLNLEIDYLVKLVFINE